MGITHSADRSILFGSEAKRYQYKTTKMTYLMIKGNEIILVNSPSVTINPPLGQIELKIKPGLEFEILEIKKYWNFNIGYSFGAKIKFLNHPQLEKYIRKSDREIFMSSLESGKHKQKLCSISRWHEIDFKEKKKEEVSTILKMYSDLMKDHEGDLYMISFFDNLPKDFNINKMLNKITIKDKSLQLINI